MNTLNRAASSLFDILLAPFEVLGHTAALVLVSGLCGILGLLVFKRISWQSGIKGVKDKIKGNMIAIRLYQDDLGIVSKSVGKVLLRNVQYLTLNFGPILLLLAPMVIVAAQFVVRYAYDPLPVVASDQKVAGMLPGEGTLVEIALKPEQASRISELRVELPEGLQALYPRPEPDGTPVLVRSRADGKAYFEVVARKPLSGELTLYLGNERVGTKEVVAGPEPERRMQPERVSSFWESWLYPAEDTFGDDTPLESVAFQYPERELGLPLIPNGELGILLAFLVASMLFGAAIVKPLNIQI